MFECEHSNSDEGSYDDGDDDDDDDDDDGRCGASDNVIRT